VTNIVVNNQRGAGRFSRVSVGGPSLATINAQSSTPVQRASLARSNRVGTASLSGNRLSVFAPRVTAASGTTLRPSRVAATVTHERINSGASLSDPLQVTAQVRAPAADPAQVAAARNTRFSADAHIATPATQAQTTLTRPLSSFQPHEARSVTPGVSASSESNRAVSHSAVNSTHEDALTGGNGAEVHHASSNAETVRTPDTGTTETDPSFHENAATPQVQHSYVAPQAEVGHPTEHSEVTEHHEDVHPAGQVQHEESHPQAEHHDAAPQHPSTAAAKSSGGGKDSGKDAGKDDKKK